MEYQYPMNEDWTTEEAVDVIAFSSRLSLHTKKVQIVKNCLKLTAVSRKLYRERLRKKRYAASLKNKVHTLLIARSNRRGNLIRRRLRCKKKSRGLLRLFFMLVILFG